MISLFLVATYRADNDGRLEQAIAGHYPDNHYGIGRGQWLVTAHGTATGVAETLDILSESSPVSGSYVLCVSEYVGRGKPDMGEWMDSKAPRSIRDSYASKGQFISGETKHNFLRHAKRLIINLLVMLGLALASFIYLFFFPGRHSH
jgi:hypothetical protein